MVAAISLTQTQRSILVALCRPVAAGRFQTPATNQEIADEVYLSVDAVKAHLRTLYRKFGIEDLPHNRKRARLVELALEGGYLGEDAAGGEEKTPAASSPTAAPPAAVSEPWRTRRRWLPLLAALAVALLVAVLGLAGVFSSGDSAPSTGVAAYREAVRGYCRLALANEGDSAGRTRRQRAGSYLEVIETVRGRVASLPPPAAASRALERFRAGLTSAANFTSIVAQSPPAAGSATEAKVVAELTFAAGQVQAGALGYDLGTACLEVGDLVAASAANAAAP
ncbi:MAG TPA: hypothetical protein VMT37_09830 [Solirubrobacterales bacterium]|nr:hypothetical protein [Solirubrobacterales bacterium]